MTAGIAAYLSADRLQQQHEIRVAWVAKGPFDHLKHQGAYLFYAWRPCFLKGYLKKFKKAPILHQICSNAGEVQIGELDASLSQLRAHYWRQDPLIIKRHIFGHSRIAF